MTRMVAVVPVDGRFGADILLEQQRYWPTNSWHLLDGGNGGGVLTELLTVLEDWTFGHAEVHEADLGRVAPTAGTIAGVVAGEVAQHAGAEVVVLGTSTLTVAAGLVVASLVPDTCRVLRVAPQGDTGDRWLPAVPWRTLKSSRRLILLRLAECHPAGRYGTELAEEVLGVPKADRSREAGRERSSVSWSLRHLRSLGLIARRKDGHANVNTLTESGLALAAALEGLGELVGSERSVVRD